MINRVVIACGVALFLVAVAAPVDVDAQRQDSAKGGIPGPPGGGGENENPLVCFDVGEEGGTIETQTAFGEPVATLVPSTTYPNASMFGRPLVAELDRGTGQDPGAGDIVLAVGSRGPSRVHIFRLAPGESPFPLVTELAVPELPDPSRRIVAAYFNDDDLPDFVVSGFGPVQVLVSPTYAPVTLQNEGDGIAATNDYIAVGVEGGKRSLGDVFLYDVVGDSPSCSREAPCFEPMLASLVGPSNGSRFGDDVALGDFGGVGNDQDDPDLVVGASGAKPPEAGKKDTNYGVALAYADVLDWGAGVELASGKKKDERLGWQVEIAGQKIFVATHWGADDRRVEVHPRPAHPEEPVDLRPKAANLGGGWASGGIGIGTIGPNGGALSAIVGAPNGRCDGWDHSAGVAYLYEGLSEAPQIFVPPHTEADPIPADWNVFGWSADIIKAGGSDFVIIGEPGFRAGGRVYVYRRD